MKQGKSVTSNCLSIDENALGIFLHLSDDMFCDIKCQILILIQDIFKKIAVYMREYIQLIITMIFTVVSCLTYKR